jgi:hypothetical protein
MDELSVSSEGEEDHTDNEPDDQDDMSDVQDVINHFQRREDWNEERWSLWARENRSISYRRSYRLIQGIPRLRDRPFIIPFDESDYAEVRYAIHARHHPHVPRLLDRTITGDRIVNGNLELRVTNQIQAGCWPYPRYTYDVELTGEQIRQRRMDRRGFPRDHYQGRRIFTSSRNQNIGWFPMRQLCFLCPDLVMTYFLRMRPIEEPENDHWRQWAICYDIIRTQETYEPQDEIWQHLELSDFSDTDDSVASLYSNPI